MFDEEFEYQPIARCDECGELIYDDSAEIYVDNDGNYFCELECALNYYGIHKAEDCLVGD
jgi:formylmethanofuran dehydrogenase subunit E